LIKEHEEIIRLSEVEEKCRAIDEMKFNLMEMHKRLWTIGESMEEIEERWKNKTTDGE
jgi:hypothetical protein